MTKTKFRITGVLLTIAILLATFSSFAIPAFAAESEPIISGGNEGEVSGNFNPEIAFTDINVIDEEDIVYYEKDGVYIVVILPDKSAADFPNMQLVGTNLEYLDKDNVLLQVKSSVYASYGDYYEPDFIEPLEYLIEENFLLYNWSGMRDGSWTEYCYSNDGGNTWSDVIRFEAKQSYTITNDTSDTNGTVTIPSYSVAGETVNVDVSPTYGYRLDTLTVTDAKGNPVIVENKAFTMPTSAVTVNAVFAVCDHSSNQHVEFDDKGFCVNNCGAGYEPALLNADGYYEINNAGNLYWFAQLVNIDGVTNANAILMNDIDLENRVWYPIGLYNDIAKENGELVRKQYAGILNGNNHTISNFKAIGNGSQGLIGYSDRNAQVRNLGVINATVSGWNAGAIIAYSGIIENCYAINCKITAYTSDSSAIKVYAGAVAGSQQATLKNCFAYNCEIIVGEGYENKSTIAPVGGKTPENCYYANVTATNGTFRINENEMNALPAQLEIGEVAYLLGSAWGMGEDELPTLGATPVTEGYSIYGQQLNIGGDLSMKYYVIAFGDEIVTKDLTMEFFFLGKKTEVIGFYDSETRMYVFTLDGINPQCMGDKIDAYLLLDGEEKANKLDYTVEANLLTLREKYKDDTALVTLVNDILAYGSAASEYKGYGSMTDDYVSSDREIPTTNVAPSDAFTGYTVTFGQMNYIKIRVNLADGNTLYLGETDITNELVDGVYKTAGIAPTDFYKVFTFTVKNGEETVATFALSVNDYISAMQNDASIGNLVKALYNYGVSAEVYEHRFTGEGEHVYVETAPNDNQTHKVICVCGHEVTEAHELVDGKCECGVYEITIGNVTAKNFDGTDRVWKSGDTIKVDVWDKDNGGYERTELTYDGTSWGSIITDTKNPVVFAVIGNGDAFANKNSYDIFVYDQQEQSQNVDDYDLMYAYKASINTDAQLDLHFEHLFTKITLNIEYGSEFTETPKIEYVLFVSEPLKPFVTITGINDGNLNFEYAEDWVHPSKFINYGDEADMTDDTVEVIVGIGTLPAGYDFIHFYDRFGTTEPWKKVLVPEGGLTFKDGEEYEFKILITADGAYIVCNDGCTDFTYTVGENGTHTKTCADCGYEATETHSFDDGVCLCGARLIIDLTQYEVGATIDITQSCIIIGNGTEYNLSLNIAENATVVFEEGTGGVKLNAITVADNKTLTLQVKGSVEHIVKEGISIGNGSNVIIEGERDKENNKLTVTATDGNAAIGANNGVTAGDITIRNARVEATGSSTIEEYSESPVSGAAIGTSDANMGDILIENSIITATGSAHSTLLSFAAAIGSGSFCESIGNIVFVDSEITAKITDESLASVIGAGCRMHGERGLVGTMGDIVFTNTSLNLSIVQNLLSYGALIGNAEMTSYFTVNMGKIIFTDMTQAELDAMIATWTYPEDFAEWGAYIIGRSPYNIVDEKGTIDGVYVSDGNGGTVQIGNADGYNPTGYVTNWGW